MFGAALKEESNWTGLTGFTGLVDGFILSILLILSKSLLYGAFARNKPQIKAPRVAPLEGASTYAPGGAYVSMHCGGHNADERRFIVSDMYRRGAGSLPAGLRQWRRAEGRGLGIGERGAQMGGRCVFGGMIFLGKGMKVIIVLIGGCTFVMTLCFFRNEFSYKLHNHLHREAT